MITVQEYLYILIWIFIWIYSFLSLLLVDRPTTGWPVVRYTRSLHYNNSWCQLCAVAVISWLSLVQLSSELSTISRFQSKRTSSFPRIRILRNNPQRIEIRTLKRRTRKEILTVLEYYKRFSPILFAKRENNAIFS